MDTYISHNTTETQALGEAWGRTAPSGLVIALTGDLGAGKTQLVKGLAHGLGFTGRVSSPTFALVNIYSGGRLTLFHLDLYRLDTPEQVLGAGLEEYLNPVGVTVIEWAERLVEVQSSKFKVRSQQDAGSPPGQAEGPASALTHHASRITHHLRWVNIASLNETERRIEYEDIGH